jgi:hypothetical protein
MTKDEAQSRASRDRWTFYEAVKLRLGTAPPDQVRSRRSRREAPRQIAGDSPALINRTFEAWPGGQGLRLKLYHRRVEEENFVILELIGSRFQWKEVRDEKPMRVKGQPTLAYGGLGGFRLRWESRWGSTARGGCGSSRWNWECCCEPGAPSPLPPPLVDEADEAQHATGRNRPQPAVNNHA